jgi:predicted DCC family thiol-disulfide oxidoreductase YuxK
LIYDGGCAFCRWTLERGRAVLTHFPEATGSASIDLAQFGLTPRDAARAVHLYTADGRLFSGHRAVGMVLLGQPLVRWRIFGAAALTPPTSWLAAISYRFVARYRGRLWRLVELHDRRRG